MDNTDRLVFLRLKETDFYTVYTVYSPKETLHLVSRSALKATEVQYETHEIGTGNSIQTSCFLCHIV